MQRMLRELGGFVTVHPMIWAQLFIPVGQPVSSAPKSKIPVSLSAKSGFSYWGNVTDRPRMCCSDPDQVDAMQEMIVEQRGFRHAMRAIGYT